MSTPPSFAAIRAPISEKDGKLNWIWLKKFIEWEQKLNGTLTILGQIQATTQIQGHAGDVGTIVQNLDGTGQFDADAVIDGVVNGITDFNERTGGGRGFTALDSNSRLASSFYMNAVNANGTPLGATALSNNGAVTAITIAANTQQFAFGQVAYNSGSIDPGIFGSFYVYCDDPTFAGGAVTYLFSMNAEDITAAEGRVLIGAITTTGGTPQTGGGQTGGTTPGSEGGRGYILV